ncbi:hypothetical protein KC323_g89 [Hortaea werneckii]|nr:hypothetical protein KC323_g89 [Hortaea werneckii]
MSKEQCVTGKASRYHMAGRSLLIHAVAWPVNLHAHDHASQANRSSLDDLPNVMSANPTTRGATAWELGSHNEGCMEPLAFAVVWSAAPTMRPCGRRRQHQESRTPLCELSPSTTSTFSAMYWLGADIDGLLGSAGWVGHSRVLTQWISNRSSECSPFNVKMINCKRK